MGNKNITIKKPRINNEIVGHSEVRLVYKKYRDSVSDSDFNKIVSWQEAVDISDKMELDLIEINPNANPIIVRLEDFSKYMYNLKKQQKQRTKNTVVLKEIQLSANISMHDLQIKANKAKEFIANGDKVKVVLTLKGRELTRKEESKKSFYQFIEIMMDSGIASFDAAPRDEERKSIVIFKKK